jgi:hypothetical protein
MDAQKASLKRNSGAMTLRIKTIEGVTNGSDKGDPTGISLSLSVVISIEQITITPTTTTTETVSNICRS